MTKRTAATIFLLGLLNSVFSQTLKTFRGTIDYKFHLSSTNAIKPVERNNFEKEMAPYFKKMDLLSSYYIALNKGDTTTAEKLLSKDTLLSEDNDFTIAYMFSLARMKRLGILYKPCIQVNDSEETKIIVCTVQQQKQFIKHANSKKYKLECKYIGYLVIDNIQVYQLIRYK